MDISCVVFHISISESVYDLLLCVHLTELCTYRMADSFLTGESDVFYFGDKDITEWSYN